MDDDEARVDAREIAVRLLARREHSGRELCRKLRERGFDAALAEEVTAVLADEGLVSDRRFAEEYVRARCARGFGPVRIRAELRERGVDDALAEPFLRGEEDWVERAAEARRKRFGSHPPRDVKERARQYRFLSQRGFDSDTIRAAFESD